MNVNELIIQMRMPDEVTPEFVALHEKIETAHKAGTLTDDILSECTHDYGECIFCAVIICPHHEPLHLHHDGCPACVADEKEAV